MAPHEDQQASDDESAGEEFEWLLGFVEPPERPADLLRHRFPSKVGGRPAWLDPLHLPTPQQLACRVTGKPMDFLLQVRASNAAGRHVPVQPAGERGGRECGRRSHPQLLRCMPSPPVDCSDNLWGI